MEFPETFTITPNKVLHKRHHLKEGIPVLECLVAAAGQLNEVVKVINELQGFILQYFQKLLTFFSVLVCKTFL